LNESKGEEITDRTIKNEQKSKRKVVADNNNSTMNISSNNLKKFSIASNDFHRVGIGIGLGNEERLQLHYNNSISTNDLSKLYPPGRILHIVRRYYKNTPTQTQTTSKTTLKTLMNGLSKTKNQQNDKLCYKIIEADNKQFNEILISPRMIQDHMPNHIQKTMKQVNQFF
jgi:hypothetical protein